MKTHMDYAIEFTREMYGKFNGNRFFRATILYGSVAEDRARKNSDVDIMLISKERTEGYYNIVDKLFRISEASPVRFDLELVEEKVLLNDEFLENRITTFEDPSFYVNIINKGLLFDGEKFVTKIKNVPFFQDCLNRMTDILKEMSHLDYITEMNPLDHRNLYQKSY